MSDAPQPGEIPESVPDNPFFAEMMATDGHEMTFDIGRTENRLIDRQNRSYSQEAIEFMFHQMQTWVGTRIMRQWKHDRKPPVRMRIHMRVEFIKDGNENQR